MKTPVAFIIFNRPDTTRRVFEAIRQAQPPKLLVIADGPRGDRPDEADKCIATRNIIKEVDWDCEVLTNYSDTNLGCKKRVSSGINWVFDQVEEAIILEDDCLPDPSFFPFCEELLEKYRHDTRIMMISGDNFQFGKARTQDSYYFSKYYHIWGWATWRRAWQHYDVDLKQWPKIRDGGWLKDIFNNDWLTIKYRSKIFQKMYEKAVDTWDYQWSFTCWTQSGLSIMPNVNLISNIGFGEAASRTKNNKSIFANMAVSSVDFPLLHPDFVIRDLETDQKTARLVFGYPARIQRKLKQILGL
ncbi:methyltransferase FkbM [[Leptolyngbya] sp. PCC 7376]|uniref:methyltransferase FkbM n=1 Tax=[Leptolyngbya] sp. PCC 7376 TaxID=111781 RepID=UPI00029F2A3C|nr:methyltransferase FkbM [[Leptolyngbya] sp. PCC 7376]AFY39023.1 methyltransferase FkbM [[Leptolyngbya] sp. PCC 7376]